MSDNAGEGGEGGADCGVDCGGGRGGGGVTCALHRLSVSRNGAVAASRTHAKSCVPKKATKKTSALGGCSPGLGGATVAGHHGKGGSATSTAGRTHTTVLTARRSSTLRCGAHAVRRPKKAP